MRQLVMNKMRHGKDGKNERTETNWTKMKKAEGAIWRESWLSEPACIIRNRCGIKMAMQSFFDEHAKEMWEINWVNLEMQITLLNTHLPKLIATILKA